MRNSSKEFARIVSLRRVHDPLSRPLLNNAAGAHHNDAVAEKPHHIEIMRDEQITHPERLFEILQQIEHNGLHRDVERRRRLVEDDKIRAECNGARDADARLLQES